jgi:short-subunit dehydrogenase
MNTEKYTLITGASHGIGLAMARECARRGRNIALVALDEPMLHAEAAAIAQEFGVKTAALGIDLTLPGAPVRVFEWTKAQGIQLNMLINNAGFGRGNYYENIPWPVYQTMLTLNNQVPAELTHLFLPDLKKEPEAHLLNVSSMEGLMAMPVKVIYSSTKFFIYAFTLALREELHNFPIKVSLLCPGPVVTNEDGLQRIKSAGWKAKLVVMYPDQVAPIAIAGLLKGKRIIIPGIFNRIITIINGMVPLPLRMRSMRGVSRAAVPKGVDVVH